MLNLDPSKLTQKDPNYRCRIKKDAFKMSVASFQRNTAFEQITCEMTLSTLMAYGEKLI